MCLHFRSGNVSLAANKPCALPSKQKSFDGAGKIAQSISVKIAQKVPRMK
jgi:hypothetical protein